MLDYKNWNMQLLLSVQSNCQNIHVHGQSCNLKNKID